MRISLLILCLLVTIPAHADDWTGIGAYIMSGDSDWNVGNDLLEADFNLYGLRVEAKTETDLRIGVSAGQFDVTLLDKNGVLPYEIYDGQFLMFYLRLPFQLTQSIHLHAQLNYQYNLGNQRDNEENEINWDEVSFNLGLSLRLGQFSIRPFVEYKVIDGDLTGSGTARLFDADEQQSRGLLLDYYIEKDAFVRIRFSHGGSRSFLLSVAREF